MNNHSSVHALPPGTLLQNGKYRIIRFISAGGFGCTYEAIHTLFDERVAIKELFVGDFCNRDALTGHVTVATLSKQPLVAKLHRKFIDEAKAQRHLNHAGIVRVTDVFEENSTAYYVMDYIDGRSLHEFPGRMPEAAAVAYIRQVAAAMAYVHSTGRLHLDIKPGNIMIDQHGRAILIDFGTSKQYDEANGQNTSTLLGLTPGFASPEQMSGQIKAFTPAADIYSLGATLYRLLSGVTPPDVALRFSGTSVQPLPATISAATRRAVESAMQLDIRLRPASMNAFIAMLDGVDDATIPASGPTPAPAHKYASTHTPAPGPRKTSRTTYIAIAATALIAGAILFFLLRGKGDEREATSAAAPLDSATTDAVSPAAPAEPDFAERGTTGMVWHSPLGTATYSGPVIIDPVTGGYDLPHGKGVAKITAGEYAGCVYDGEFQHGKMQGQATYTTADGDTFVGTFKDNKYHKGIYTVKSSGVYFEGTFKDGQPDQGTWYDKNGHKM